MSKAGVRYVIQNVILTKRQHMFFYHEVVFAGKCTYIKGKVFIILSLRYYPPQVCLIPKT